MKLYILGSSLYAEEIAELIIDSGEFYDLISLALCALKVG